MPYLLIQRHQFYVLKPLMFQATTRFCLLLKCKRNAFFFVCECAHVHNFLYNLFEFIVIKTKG